MDNNQRGARGFRAQTPPRVAARMEGKVKNRGTKPVRKQSRGKS